MPFFLEIGSGGHSFGGKAIVVNSRTGEHKSLHPIPLAKAKAQKRLLEGIAEKEDDPHPHKFIKKVVEGPKFRAGADKHIADKYYLN